MVLKADLKSKIFNFIHTFHAFIIHALLAFFQTPNVANSFIGIQESLIAFELFFYQITGEFKKKKMMPK